MYNIFFSNILSCVHFDYYDKKTSRWTLVVKTALSTLVNSIFFFTIIILRLYHVYEDVKYTNKGRPWTNLNDFRTQNSWGGAIIIIITVIENTRSKHNPESNTWIRIRLVIIITIIIINSLIYNELHSYYVHSRAVFQVNEKPKKTKKKRYFILYNIQRPENVRKKKKPIIFVFVQI